MKKLAAGYYTMEYKGQKIDVIKTFMEWSGETLWYCIVNDDDSDVGDYSHTKRHCLEVGKYMVDNDDRFDINLR